MTNQNQTAQQAVDTAVLDNVESSGTAVAMWIPNSYKELNEFAAMMATTIMVPKHLRHKKPDCMAVAMQAFRWGMDPYAVSNKTYFVNDRIGYEAQLINAVVNTRAPLKERLDVSWEGEGEDLKCTVSGTLKGDSKPHVRTVAIKTITTRNSPLWKQDPEQQLAYDATRKWARLYCPEVILGVYAVDEVEALGPENARDVTPAQEPKRSDFRADLGETVEELAEQDITAFEIWDHFGEQRGAYTAGPWADRYGELAIEAARDGHDCLDLFIQSNNTVAAEVRKGLSEPAIIGEHIEAANQQLRPGVIDVDAETGEPEETVDGREEHVNGEDLTTDEIAGTTPTEENAAPAEETAEPDTPSLESLITTGKLNADEGMQNLSVWWKGLGGTLQNVVGGPELDRLKARAREADQRIAAENAARTQDEIPFDGDNKATE